MKPEAIIINASRGSIVDEAALIDALLNKKIKGAGLDVYENEPFVPQTLRIMDNVVLTPHIGTATKETRCAMTELACRSILAVLQGRKPYNVVNPEVYTEANK
jgi:lactate dehydrogenase-like 2-hydroxyacid dehydrogenase